MFQDETGTVTQKARSQYSKPTLSVGDNSFQALNPMPQLQLLVDPQSVQAICFFTSAYAGGCYMDWLPTIYLSRERPASLEASFEAVALSYMANEQHRRDLQILAHKSYGVGLTRTIDAIKGNQSASPGTIASVLLLALFAVISSESYQDAQNIWSKHVHGILAMLEPHLSPTIFNNVAGQSLLHHIISVIQMDCIQRRLPFPPHLKLLYSASCLNQGYQEIFWVTLDRLAALNAQLDAIDNSLLCIAQSEEIDSMINALLSSMPQAYPGHFSFQDISNGRIIDGGKRDFSPPVHIFSSWRSAQAWNTLRMIRLYNLNFLRSSIIGYLSSNNMIAQEIINRLRVLLGGISTTAYQTAMDTCASVPGFLRPDGWSSDSSTRLQNSSWARSLIWPLSLAKAAPHGSEQLKDYIEKQVQLLGATSGIRALNGKTAFLSTKDNW